MKLEMLSPMRRLNDMRQQLADSQERMRLETERRLTECRHRLELAAGRLYADSPAGLIAQRRRQTGDLRLRLKAASERKLMETKHRLALDAGKLDGLSPLKRLTGGFGYVTDEGGRAVGSAGQLTVGRALQVRFADGRVRTRVEEIDQEPAWTGMEEE